MNQTTSVLYIEDDVEDFVLLSHALESDEKHDFSVTHAETIHEGIDQLKKRAFNLVLLDLNLPDSNGLDSFDKVKELAVQTPIVVLTGHVDDALGVEAVNKGAQDYVLKSNIHSPNFISSLLYAIERVKVEEFKDELISNVSHELRTPMAIVRECISQIHDQLHGPVTEGQKKFLAKSITNIDRLSNIINNLLDASKLSNKKVKLKKNVFDLVEVSKFVLSNFSFRLEEKRLEFKVDSSSEKVNVYADKEKIIQILTNFIGNSVKFTKQGFVTISIKEDVDKVFCSVLDTGRGLSKEDQEHLFKRFKQFGRVHGAGEKGTGLGLNICKQLIELHGSKIKVESKEGFGTKFTFDLPSSKSLDCFLEDIKEAFNLAENLSEPLSCIVATPKDQSFISTLTLDMQENFLKELTDLAKISIHRTNDQVIKYPGGVVLLLPNVSPKDCLVISKRFADLVSCKLSDLYGCKEFSIEDFTYPNNINTHQPIFDYMGVPMEVK